MSKLNEEELLARRNELETELERVKDSLNYIELERRNAQLNSINNMVAKDPAIWSIRLRTQLADIIDNIGSDHYRVLLELCFDPLSDD